MSFSKIPVDASTKMPDDLMDSIEPFNYKEMRPFGMEYMPGYLANKYDVTKEESRKRADDRAVGSFRAALRDSVKNYDSVNVRQQSEKIRPEKAEYGMLPVWLLSSNWQGKTYLFAMNGQSGKMIGDLPVSKPKLAAWVTGIFAVVFALLYFLITGAVMNSSMKPVAKSHSAGAYVSDGGSLRLSRHDDRFVRTTETRRQVQSSGGPGSGGPGGAGGHGRPGGGPGRPGGPGGPRR